MDAIEALRYDQTASGLRQGPLGSRRHCLRRVPKGDERSMKTKSSRKIWGTMCLGLVASWAAARSLHLAAADVSTTVPAASAAVAAQPGGFKYFVGIVGNPSVPDIRWSDEELEQIKALGVNIVQLSIAWGHKPADEVLNLEDLDAEQREKFAFRIQQAKKHGLRTMAHFGIPRMINDGPLQPACILDPAVQRSTGTC